MKLMEAPSDRNVINEAVFLLWAAIIEAMSNTPPAAFDQTLCGLDSRYLGLRLLSTNVHRKMDDMINNICPALPSS